MRLAMFDIDTNSSYNKGIDGSEGLPQKQRGLTMIKTFDLNNGWNEFAPKSQRTAQNQEAWYLTHCTDEHELAVIYDGESAVSAITWEDGRKVATHDPKMIQQAIADAEDWWNED